MTLTELDGPWHTVPFEEKGQTNKRQEWVASKSTKASDHLYGLVEEGDTPECDGCRTVVDEVV
jgi:hypothetical protein